MRVKETPIAGLLRVGFRRQRDRRGSFSRWYCGDQLRPHLGDRRIAQINHSDTARRGAVRGMHFQYPPAAEVKMVRCLRGAVYDVTVDLRARSNTLLTWHGETLREDDDDMLVIPEGCAHGFQALEENTQLLYLHTAPYTADLEGGLRYDDPAIGIAWPLAVTDVSDRDRAHPLIDAEFTGVPS